MAVKNEQIEKNLVKLTFEVSAEDFDKAINQVYKKNVKKFNVLVTEKEKLQERLSKSIIQRLYSMMKLLTAYFRRLMTKL